MPSNPRGAPPWATPPPRSRWRLTPFGLVLVGIVAFSLLSALWTQASGRIRIGWEIHELRKRQEEDLLRLESDFRRQHEDRERRHQAAMDDPDLASGRLAERARARELEARLRREPRFATTPMEKAMVEMEKVGHDPGVADLAAVQRVAELAAPTSSKVSVEPESGGYLVRIAFPLSSVSEREGGVTTKHPSVETLRQEVEQRTLQVARDVLVHAGPRGIRRLSIACNHGIHTPFNLPGSTEAERMALSTSQVQWIYRIRMSPEAIQPGTDWRMIRDRDLMGLAAVDDGPLRILSIVDGRLPEIPTEPDGRTLEF